MSQFVSLLDVLEQAEKIGRKEQWRLKLEVS